jgi:prepilin-type N-terminal cleavage/methylation domain-containing protein
MKNKGFTLVELLIYIAIIGVLLVSMVGFLWTIVSGNIKETAYQEVQQNGRSTLTKITQEIKKATGVINPSPGFSASSLSLSMADPNLNPTIFNLIDGKLRITQRANSYYLTSDQVIVSNLQFTNLSYEDTPGTIRIEMTLERINPANRTEYQASLSLNSTVSLVRGGASASPHAAQLHYRWRNDDGGE